VFGMLRDKDIAGVVRELVPRVTRWHLATLRGERGADAAELAAILLAENTTAAAAQHASAALAFAAAREESGENDKILVFGSFLTVGEVMKYLESLRGGAPHG
ncbi:MAG: glutamate ligase domain-containing protein, partial [Burkholderiales bacterium]